MNVWVIGRGYPTGHNKVQGSFELEQARMLSKAGCKVTYLALTFHPFRKIKKWGYCTWNENDITVCTYSQIYAPERFYLHLEHFQQKKWRDFLQRVEKQCGKPDVIHVHYPTMITEADVILEYQSRGTKVIVTEHWTKALTGELKKHHVERMTKYVEGADAFLCVGAPLKDSVKRITNTKNEIYIVPNVVADVFKFAKKQTLEKKDKFEYIAVGRLVPVKQFDKIIEAFAEAFGGNQDAVKLTIVGSGDEEEKLHKLVDKYQLRDVVTLTGALTQSETAKRVMASDALICYSRLETFGVPVIEAWACGKPVIASDCLGFLEYWDDGLGMIVPWNDTSKLKAAMEKMYGQTEIYDGEYISRFASRHFSEDAISKRLLEYYGMNCKQEEKMNMENAAPGVSIIVAAYNMEKYLDECLSSIQQQTFGDIEVIVVDDGSTDKTGEICDRFASGDARFHIVHKKNEGVCAARNDGLKRAIGEWCLFCDADDWLEKDACRIIYENGKKTNADIIWAGNKKVTPAGCIDMQIFNESFLLTERREIDKLILLMLDWKTTPRTMKSKGNINVCWNKAMRTVMLQKKGIMFDASVGHMTEDMLFNLYAFKAADSVSYVTESIYFYRQVERSAANGFMRGGFAWNDALFAAIEEFIENATDDPVFKEQLYCSYYHMVIERFKRAVEKYCFHSNNLNNKHETKQELKKNIQKKIYQDAARKVDRSTLTKVGRCYCFVIKRKSVIGVTILYNCVESLRRLSRMR